MRQSTRIVALAALAISGERAFAQDLRALIFSKTTGFRLSSIPDGIDMIQNPGTANHFAVDTLQTEGRSAFEGGLRLHGEGRHLGAAIELQLRADHQGEGVRLNEHR